MLEANPQHGRHRVQPGYAVVHHENRLTARSEHAAALLRHAPRVMCVLQDAVPIDHVEALIVERQRFAVAHLKISLSTQTMQLEVGPGERDRLFREVDTGHVGPAAGESNQVGADPTADLEQPLATIPGEVDEPGQVAQLVEAIVVEGIKETERADWFIGHLQIVNTPVPVSRNGVGHVVSDGGADLGQAGLRPEPPQALAAAPSPHSGPAGRASSRARVFATASVQYSTVIRDLRALADTQFDLLVVGAGIYGATLAWDAAQRGLAVALIDRGDFGGGTSANSLKTVHGGVRALQSGNASEMRLFVRERRALSRIAPHLVHPLPFVVPTYSGLTRNPVVMRTGFGLYDLVAHDRNDLPDRSKHLPRSRLVSRNECLALSPHIDPAGVTGGIVWHDCQMYSSDRVLLSFIQSAAEAGAVAANYVEATGWVREAERIIGVQVEDRAGAARFEVRGTLVVNAAGPWSRALMADLPPALTAGRPPGLSKAMNLVTRSITTDHAVGGMAGSRFLFAAPWRSVSIVGTSHDPFDGPGGAPSVGARDVATFLREINTAFPGAALQRSDVRLVHRGLLPADDDAGHDLLKESLVHDHRADGVPGLMSVLGVRYTTARATAEQATDLACSILGRTAPPCRTATTPIGGGSIQNWDVFLRDAVDERTSPLDAEVRGRLARTYGSKRAEITRTLERDRSLAAPLSNLCGVTKGELVHATRHEMAVRLSDAVLRRTEAGSDGHPGIVALDAAAQVMGDELGWTAEDRAREVAHVERVYRVDP